MASNHVSMIDTVNALLYRATADEWREQAKHPPILLNIVKGFEPDKHAAECNAIAEHYDRLADEAEARIQARRTDEA